MQQIINFIIRNRFFLLFLFLFSIALAFTIQSHSYHRSKFINSANFLTGTIYNATNSTSKYIDLKYQNQLLTEENKQLKSILYNSENQLNPIFKDSIIKKKTYTLTTANVIKNSYNVANNILLLNKGGNDSIKQDFGVITTKGVVGIIDRISNNYSTVVSILNTTSKISAKLKKTSHFGSLIWDGKSPNTIQLIDVEKTAPIKIGDTITTSGYSSIFPKGINIGTIKDFKLDKSENYYEINISLFNDMTNIEHVYIIDNKNIKEIHNLLNKTDE